MKTNNQITQNYNETELLTYMEVLYASGDEAIVDEIIDMLAESLTEEWEKASQTQLQTQVSNIETLHQQILATGDLEKIEKLNKRIQKAEDDLESGKTMYDIRIAFGERNSVEQFSERVKSALPQSVIEDIRKVYLTPSFTWLADFEASGCNLKADLDKAMLLASKHCDAVNWKYSYKQGALSLISSSFPHLFVSSPYSVQAKHFNESLLKEAETGRYVLTYEIMKSETDIESDEEDDLFAILGDTKSKYSVKWHVYDRACDQEVPLTRAVADIVNADNAISTVLELVNPSQKTNWLALCERVRDGLKALMRADAYEVLAAKILWLAKIKYSNEVRLVHGKLQHHGNHSYDLRFTGWAYSSDKAMIQRIAAVLREHDIDVVDPRNQVEELKVAICALNKIKD